MKAARPSSTRRSGPARAAAIVAAALLAAALAPPGQGQALAESAQREKERREAVTAGKAVAITNADLLKVRKRLAVTLEPPAAGPAAGGPAEALGAPASAADPPKPSALGEAAPAWTAAVPASLHEGNAKQVREQKTADLRNQWNAARERVGFLETKLLGLQQRAMKAVTPDERESLAKDVEAATRTLDEARLAERKAKVELEKLLQGDSDVRK